jgi:hypothetical protein
MWGTIRACFLIGVVHTGVNLACGNKFKVMPIAIVNSNGFKNKFK